MARGKRKFGAGAELPTLAGLIARLEQRTGMRLDKKSITENMTFRQWCQKLSDDGLKVDGKPFKLENRPAMAWIYDQIPSTRDEAYRYILVLMKCAQVGFTVMEMLAAIYMGIKFGPATVGMFLPDMRLTSVKSMRFMESVRTVPEVHALMTEVNEDGNGRKAGEGNVFMRRIRDALFAFSWTSGKATTESIPMDILSFDEVQEMTLAQIEKAYERVSASEIRFMLMGSTANWPEADIHHWYLQGTRHRFHTECQTCGTKKPLDDYFPECVKLDKERDLYRYVCPNGHWINDPQVGEWIAEYPEADRGPQPGVPLLERHQRIKSIHFPQFLSPTISAEEILTAYNTATDMKNFFNRKLGKPYLDPSQVPVTLEHCRKCVEAGKLANPPIVWKTRARHTYMGIDQMGNFNVHVIKERLPDGRQAVIHVEETYSADPFERSSELMDMYGVSVCVVEINPNYNDAKKFANRHPGRVFICDSFGTVAEGMIQWGDAPKLDVSERRTDEEARDRYTLRMDQFKCMQVSMARITTEACLFPDPQGLIQEVLEKGVKQTAAVLPRMFHHFTKTALVAEISKEDEKKGIKHYRRSVKKIGIDPHFSYANMLCDVAWSRAHGTSTFIMPEAAPMKDVVEQAKKIGVPEKVAQIFEQLPPGEICGRCVSFNAETGMCEERDMLTRAASPGCVLFVEKAY